MNWINMWFTKRMRWKVKRRWDPVCWRFFSFTPFIGFFLVNSNKNQRKDETNVMSERNWCEFVFSRTQLMTRNITSQTIKANDQTNPYINTLVAHGVISLSLLVSQGLILVIQIYNLWRQHVIQKIINFLTSCFCYVWILPLGHRLILMPQESVYFSFLFFLLKDL